jgi:serine/threonine protein kinase
LVDEEGHIKLIPPHTLQERPIAFEECAQFLAPEILEGQISIGKESDWWTYGVILFFLLRGKVRIRIRIRICVCVRVCHSKQK